MTSKGLRHLQIRKNAVRESVQNSFVTISHVSGKINLADIFTKKDKDTSHFLTVRDVLMSAPLLAASSAKRSHYQFSAVKPQCSHTGYGHVRIHAKGGVVCLSSVIRHRSTR
jgi:hypothetical protein